MPLIRSPYPDGGAASSLLTGLVAYWALEEASGTRVDATGRGNDLTPTGTPGNTAGRVGQALALNYLNNERLSRASNADLQGGAGSFTLAAWIYPLDLVNPGAIFDKISTAGNSEYFLYYGSAYDWRASNNGTGLTQILSSVPTVANAWHLLIVWYDATNSQLGIQVDNGAPDTVAFTGPVFAGTSPLAIGQYVGGPITFRGNIDEAGKWNRLLTTGEKTALWNGGAGRTYPFPGT